MCPITSSYFFCTKTGERPYRGVDVIKDFASEAGVSDLSIFTFTTLRKHVTTLKENIPNIETSVSIYEKSPGKNWDKKT